MHPAHAKTQMLLELLELTPLQMVLSITIIFIAYTVKGLSGFGSGFYRIKGIPLQSPCLTKN